MGTSKAPTSFYCHLPPATGASHRPSTWKTFGNGAWVRISQESVSWFRAGGMEWTWVRNGATS